jgi:hypothetical protein
MELIKKLFKSIFILIGIACMVVVVLLAIMMIGKVSIFGFSFINLATGGNAIKIDIDTTSADKYIDNNGTLQSIIIKTDRVVPQIEYYGTESTDGSESTGIHIELSYNLQGIAKGDIKTIYFVSKEPSEVFDKSTKTLSLETIEPTGVFFRNDCKVKVLLPMEMKLKNVELQVGNAKSVILNSNAIKKVGDNKDIKQFNLDSLKITQTAANYAGLTIGKIAKWTKKNSNGTIVATGENITLKVGDLELNTVAGRVNVCCNVSGDLKINSKSGTFIFDKQTNSDGSVTYSNGIGGSVVIEGDVPSVELGTVSNNVIDLAKQNKAYEIKKEFNVAGQILVDCNALVQVSGVVSGDVGLNKNGATLRANTINGYLSATSGCGGIIVVGEVKGNILIGTDTDVNVTVNDVFIGTAKSTVTIKSNNKPVVINKLVGANCDIQSNRGNITVGSIDENSTVNLLSKDASVWANFAGASIKGENNIQATGSGNVNVKFLDGQKFKLYAKAKSKAKVQINLISFDTTTGDLKPQTDAGGYIYFEEQIYGNTDATRAVNMSVVNGTIYGSFAE